MNELPTAPEDAPRYQGACHCQAVRFTVALPDGLTRVTRCNCSLCRMRGAVAAWAWRDGLRVTQGAEHLRRYTFNTGMAEHFFCGVCGIYTHHRRRGDPRKLSVNVACLEGVSPFDFDDVPVYNGRDHALDHDPARDPPRVDPAGRVHYQSLE